MPWQLRGKANLLSLHHPTEPCVANGVYLHYSAKLKCLKQTIVRAVSASEYPSISTSRLEGNCLSAGPISWSAKPCPCRSHAIAHQHAIKPGAHHLLIGFGMQRGTAPGAVSFHSQSKRFQKEISQSGSEVLVHRPLPEPRQEVSLRDERSQQPPTVRGHSRPLM